MIGIVCHPYHRGGVTRWMADFAEEWRRRGRQCWFVTPRPRARFVTAGGRPTMVELLCARPAAVRPTVVSPSVGAEYEFGTEAYRASVYASAVSRAVPPGAPLLVSNDSAAWRGAAALSGRHPVVGVLHGDEDYYYDLASRFADALGALACVSERIRARAEARLGVAMPPGERIPCGTPLPPSPAVRDARAAGGPARLVWAGRIEEYSKRVSDLPKIAAALDAAGVNFTLDVLGDGPDAPALREAIRAAGVGARVRMLGWREADELARTLGEADVLLLPSNFEGMPVAVMEALALGCAVVATRISGIEDYERHPLADRCLWTYAVGDVAAAAALVPRALRVPAPERVAAARALAEAEFSIARCVDRYEALLARARVERRSARLAPRPFISLASYPVAAARVARLWAAGAYGPDREPARGRTRAALLA